ncbi:MAG: tRNA dihydrouridine(20/20a) synthase DusA [Tateyamaria sp.]|jgi:tRNA-dihydrouridine synthase A|nr:tRNA dihydrouridine(20/20a) synthase DusA [Tateyamaria sp.]MBT5302778.1 tRNA dihydrouridine(20/20a) synthase DusA [Tateyamaria sp.]MBT6268671.1 tRNA dihydrouridine(20/20a) synthase DusA [Tateyamaria sp.]MBT6343088.1 tRNA dihydrouridine(20/20a) synthase DusA [Tateyamaria sp.]MBT7448253.1 tRNA dihydrouridine(20/20a) synthase DusA [Tateyamaria sp.]
MPNNAVTAAARFSAAPMMDWTDRHCRFLHRQLSRQALLYTEMVTAPALIRGGAVHLLDHSPAEYPLALQLGGSNPSELARAAKLGANAGYQEVNLNCGCPSDRVKSGTFGAILMRDAALVADCVAAMRDAVDVDVTLKCRIGVDEQNPDEVLPKFLAKIIAAGCERVTIHARKAWLQGLSPKENRDIPPLDYRLVLRMKEYFPNLHISINGGITSLEQVEAFLAAGLDGVMVGRAAYHQPADIFCSADRRIFGASDETSVEEAIMAMLPYIEKHLSSGGRLHQITRHMLGLFAGRAGARLWRRTISEGSAKNGADGELVYSALSQVMAITNETNAVI